MTPIEIMFYITALPANLYPIFYAFRPWYSTRAGRALMVRAVGDLLIFDLSLAALAFGPLYPGHVALGYVAVGAFCAGIWFLFVVLMMTPRHLGNGD